MKSRTIAACLLFAAIPLAGQVVDHGIAVDFGTSKKAKQGETVEFAFQLSDTATHAPLTSARPAAWLALRSDNKAQDCTRQAATYLAGDLFARADVDLNSYFVVAMNDDASLNVVDPLFGFGGSKLLAMVELEGRGEDWALSADQSTLYVSMPSANKVAAIDTRKWNVGKNVATGPHPRRVLLRDHLFVADDEGVTAIDAKSSTRLRIGRTHDLAASDDLVFAATDHGIVVIDAHSAKALPGTAGVPPAGVASIADAGGTPVFPGRSIAYSSAAKTAYAIFGDHLLTVRPAEVSPGAKMSAAALPTNAAGRAGIKPGATQIRFAPGGRYALIANPAKNVVQVLDAATNRIVQNADISDGPDQITFTDLLAYVRRRDSETILTIPLEQLGAEGKPLSVADFPGGQHSYGEGAQSLADSIVPSVEGPSVLIANPADKMIYLYKEGMAAPAGGFSNYGRQSRAALVVDRGLRETKPGTYATTVPVTKPGHYDVVFFLDAPRVVACFAMNVEPNDHTPAKPVTRVAAIEPPKSVKSGQPAHLRFALTDAAGRERRRASDVRALAFEAPGVWQQRGDAKPLSDGTYEFTFTPPESGMFYVWVESESLGLARNNSQFMIFQAQ
jgi:DNA-binding beta-propeller fold protein YncE